MLGYFGHFLGFQGGYFGHFLGFGVFWSLFKFKGYFGHFGHFLGSKGILVILEGFGDILPILNI